MFDRKEYLLEFMRDFDYPEEAIAAILKTYGVIAENKEANKLFEQAIALYESGLYMDYGRQLKLVADAKNLISEPKETVDLCFVLCLTKELKNRYIRKSIDLKHYRTACLDFKAKLTECYDIKKIWGTFVVDWFGRWFSLTRFALGRLQFELNPANETVVIGENTVNKGDFVVSIHIPSLGPLKQEDCVESFEMAYEFFKPAFPDGLVPFRTGSWLIAPEHREMLKPDANLLKFMDFFHIIPYEKTVKGDFWRIFGKEDCSDVNTLPDDNSLRRAYIERIKQDKIPHIGIGLFFMQDGKFLDK